ncbi:MAG TPA: cohesin domain-containing protein [Clostridia bacterium]|nr:cohesin domain-containing protein [Clostridia bacterium]
MTRVYRVAVVLLIALVATLPAAADKAKSLFEKARDAEAHQNYELAYDYYKQAFDLKPKDLKYRVSYERTKFLASASHVHKGQLLRDAGRLEEALIEFRAALGIDSSSFIAQQEMKRTQQMIEEERRKAQEPAPQAENRRFSGAAGPVELAPISEAPITLKLSEDTKVIYDTIGKLAGVNVLFDPDYTSRRIKIELNGVTLNQALEITALESKTFWRPVTPNTIFVAADTTAKRKELEQSVIRTFYLTNLSTPTEIQDVTNTLRQILEISRVQQLPTQGAIVVRGTPDQIALAEKLIGDIDKARPEVVVEVAVMQVRKDRLRQLGITPPFSTTNSPSIALQGGTTTTTPTTGTPTTTTSPLTLNKLANLDARDFVVNIPSVTASFLLNDGTTKVIQNPQIRALDGQKASLKIGDRVPVATGSFQPGIGGVGINPLVNTQFQYIDVGVNIDVTPRVHAGREVSLKVMLEISAVTRTANIGGIDQPVIGQRRIEHDIRLKEGEVNLLGGIMESSDVKAMSGMPWLSQIPVLKYLFGREQVEKADNEIVFVLVPHIVRSQDVTDLNTRTLDVGTANAIDMRRETRRPPAPAVPAPVPQSMQQPPAPMSQPVQPRSTAASAQPQQGAQGTEGAGAGAAMAQSRAQMVSPAASAGTQGALVSFDPPTVNQAAGQTFAVSVVVSGAQNVHSVPLQIAYDPKTLQLLNISNGSFLGRDGQAVALVHRDDAAAGSVQVTATRPPGSGGISGDGQVFTLTFQAKAPGQSTLSINRAMLRDSAMQTLPATGSQAVVTIR